MQGNRYEGKTLHDIGISIVFVMLFACTLLTAKAGEDMFTGNLVMTIAVFVIALLAAFQFVTLSIVLCSVATVSYMGINIFLSVSQGTDLLPLSFLWLALPGLTVLGCVLYVKGQKKLQTENALLKRQVEELVMIDPLTNLYNLRSMFMDMQTQVSFAERNNQHISLMVIKLKYQEELKRALSEDEYDQVFIMVAQYVVDTVRLEDRVYSIDDQGSLAIILTTDATGCKSVVNRIRNKLDNDEAFADIAAQPIRVEVKIGYLEYNNDEFQRDARLFLSKVEEEADFDE